MILSTSFDSFFNGKRILITGHTGFKGSWLTLWLTQLGADVFGLSTQDTEYQKEMAERLHLPFLVLSDVNLQFCEAMKLPTFEVDGMRLVKRVTMIAENNIVVKVHYPIFPSDTDAMWVIEQLSY